MCPEEDSASVEWARQKDENWVNKDITSLEFVENIFRLMNWNRECRYKVLGRVANSDQGLCMLFDLEEAIMFTPKPQEYTDAQNKKLAQQEPADTVPIQFEPSFETPEEMKGESA